MWIIGRKNVEFDFFDLFGDVWDRSFERVGVFVAAAFVSEPDGDEEEEEDDGDADRDAEDDPKTEAEDGGLVGELVGHGVGGGRVEHWCWRVERERDEWMRDERRRRRRRRGWQLAWWGRNELQCVLLSVWKGVSGKYCWCGLSFTSLVKQKRDGNVSHCIFILKFRFGKVK